MLVLLPRCSERSPLSFDHSYVDLLTETTGHIMAGQALNIFVHCLVLALHNLKPALHLSKLLKGNKIGFTYFICLQLLEPSDLNAEIICLILVPLNHRFLGQDGILHAINFGICGSKIVLHLLELRRKFYDRFVLYPEQMLAVMKLV